MGGGEEKKEKETVRKRKGREEGVEITVILEAFITVDYLLRTISRIPQSIHSCTIF